MLVVIMIACFIIKMRPPVLWITWAKIMTSSVITNAQQVLRATTRRRNIIFVDTARLNTTSAVDVRQYTAWLLTRGRSHFFRGASPRRSGTPRTGRS